MELKGLLFLTHTGETPLGSDPYSDQELYLLLKQHVDDTRLVKCPSQSRGSFGLPFTVGGVTEMGETPPHYKKVRRMRILQLRDLKLGPKTGERGLFLRPESV